MTRLIEPKTSPRATSGHRDVRARRQRAGDLELALVEAEACERLIVDLANEHRLLRADRGRAGGCGRGQHRLLELPRELQLERIDVLERQPLQPVADEDVDGAPVRDPRHREPGDVGERLLVVERAAEHPAGLGEEGLPLLGDPAFFDVGVRAEPSDDRRRRRRASRPPGQMPTVGAVRRRRNRNSTSYGSPVRRDVFQRSTAVGTSSGCDEIAPAPTAQLVEACDRSTRARAGSRNRANRPARRRPDAAAESHRQGIGIAPRSHARAPPAPAP